MFVITVRTRLTRDGSAPAFLEQLLTPEDLGMSRDQYAALVGEHGDARISTSMELKDSDFGTGFGCHVTVNVRMTHGDNDVILAAGASCKLTVPDDQWDRLLAACQGVIDGLSATLGLETSGGAPTGVSLGWTEPTGKPSDEQEL